MSDPALPSPEQLEQWDLDHVWHPFTQHQEWEADGPPLIVDRADGVYLIDVRGRRYLDGVSSLWTNVHGHRHPALDAAVRDQLDRVAHSTLLGLSGTPAVHLARRLAQLVEARLPGSGLRRVFYTDAGSTAVEVALKMAFQWQQQAGNTARTRFAALTEAYHGDTLGSVSVGGIDLFHAVYKGLLFDAVRLPAPERAAPAEEAACLERAAALFAAHGDTLAAVVVEPLVQGAAGMRMHSPDFLRRLLSMARDAGALVIVDEVATGFGRTGTLFAMEQVGFSPDLLCLAKGLSGGYLPLAATLATERIFDGFRGDSQSHRTLFHGHTYTGNALACAAALANLDLFEQGDVLAGLPARVAALGQAMAAVPDRYVVERRQKGLMAGLLLRHHRGPAARIGHRVCMAARDHGVVVRPLGDLVVLMPPLAMTPDQIGDVVAGVHAAIVDVLG
ncbi:MAG: adenosylmethionine--8-amino-7-oxononanoate transaminase [Alphaproteobacteria bacterium]|nr:adenosylmethionine--8-amino-7-oxononanoate transaminase [Alphaproteobacteria bacterium]